MNRKRVAVQTVMPVLYLIFCGLAACAYAGENSRFSIGISGQIQFHQADWFFFKEVTLPEDGKTVVVNPDTDFWWKLPGIEIDWTSINGHSMTFTLRSQYLYNTFTLRDTVSSSFDRWVKSNEANLHYVSIGGIVKFLKLPLKPYVALAGGICFGSLTTNTLFESPGAWKDFFSVEGSGTATYIESSLGVEPLMPFFENGRLFIELGYRHTLNTAVFAVARIYGDDSARNRAIAVFDRKDIGIGGPFCLLGVRVRLD